MMTEPQLIRALDTVVPADLASCCTKTLRQAVRTHSTFEVQEGWHIDCIYCHQPFVLRDRVWSRCSWQEAWGYKGNAEVRAR